MRGILEDAYDVEEASNWREALEALTSTGSFDVAIVELDGRRAPGGGPGGASVIKALHKAMPGTGIVALAQRAERHAANEAIDAGASAYVAKSSTSEAFLSAVKAAADATQFVDPAARAGASGGTLTRRQRQILQLLADGNSTTDIAHSLHVSTETVRTHTKATLARLDARDRAHAVAIALRGGLID